jgi:CubicO group peptidase (beta-lactamase class C family)
MSGILTKRSGMSILEFARKYLFGPLGINIKLWRQDPQGIYIGGTEMFLTPRDMAKLGYLYLRKGFWNGQEIVPSGWINESTGFQVSTGDQGFSNYGYGYWWWRGPGFYAAIGRGG